MVRRELSENGLGNRIIAQCWREVCRGYQGDGIGDVDGLAEGNHVNI